MVRDTRNFFRVMEPEPERIPARSYLIGGFAPLPVIPPRGDPPTRYLLPHYPPQPNSFYELSSDAHVTKRYFENKKGFNAAPEVSVVAGCFSPRLSAEKNPVEVVEVGTGEVDVLRSRMLLLQEDADELECDVCEKFKEGSLLKHELDSSDENGILCEEENDKILKLRDKKEERQQWAVAEFSRRASYEPSSVEFTEGWLQSQTDEKAASRPRLEPYIDQADHRSLRLSQAGEEKTVVGIEIRQQHSNWRRDNQTINDKKRVRRSTTVASDGSIRDQWCFVHYTQMHGGRSGLNARTGRSPADLEASKHITCNPFFRL